MQKQKNKKPLELIVDNENSIKDLTQRIGKLSEKLLVLDEMASTENVPSVKSLLTNYIVELRTQISKLKTQNILFQVEQEIFEEKNK